MYRDLVFAGRMLLRRPVFTLAAVATLGLGIGATTAIFSTVNAALLRPLPFPRSEDLFTLRTTITTGRVTSGLVASVELEPLNRASGAILHATGSVASSDTILDDPTHPLQINITGARPDFFETFGLPMVVGRGFVRDEYVEGAPTVIVLSSHLWRSAFGGNPHIVGRPIRLSPGLLTVVGVAAPELDAVSGADAWWNYVSGPKSLGHIFDGYMRIRPGASPHAVQDELTTVAEQLGREFPVFNANREYVARPLIDSIVGDLKPTLIMALGATVLLLVLACVNVTNLLLARGAVRAREVAIRAALGAGHGRIIRQLLTESLLLSIIGATAGWMLAAVGVRVLLAAGGSRLPRLDRVPFEWHVLLFSIVVTMMTGVLVGFMPALRLLATDIKTLMNDGGRTASGGRRTHRALGTMIVAEIALALVIVAGAGWLVRNFQNLQSSRPGFSSERRLVFDMLLPVARYSQAARIDAWTRELLDRVSAIRGVQAVGSGSSLPLRVERDSTANVTIAGEPEQAYPPAARWRSVTPGWFEAMGVQLEAGRSFTRDDRPESAPVVIVNESFVQRYLKGTDPLRRRLVMPMFATKTTLPPEVPIIGVVNDVKYASMREPPESAFYTTQMPSAFRRQTVVVATSLADPSTLVPTIRSEVHKMDPLIPIEFDLFGDVVSSSLSRQRLGMILMTIFGLAALTLAAVGIYGVIAYAVAQRLGEMATRMALGATPRHIFWLVVKQGRALAVVGILLGLALAYSVGRLVTNQLFEVSTADPWVLGSATALVIGITAVAMLIPALRASAVDPAHMLRSE